MVTSIKKYQIKEKINTGQEIEIYRALDLEKQRGVILKLIQNLNEFHPSVVNLKNEFEIMKFLSTSDSMLQVYSFEKYESGYFLVFQDTEGISLKEYARGNSLDLETFFQIATKISDLLFTIHKSKVIHKDIKPENIIINPNSLDVKIIDFGISTRLSKEETKWSAPNVLEGSIQYISPEQTGRMNRSVDYRSDFYSLGITLYELLAGFLPFNNTDLLELVHAHLAKTPPSLHSIKPEVFPALSKIIDKLISKTAENRYQTSFGLKRDLEKAYGLYREKRNVAGGTDSIDFPTGEFDLSDNFSIQQKLYGRETDIQTLLETFHEIHRTGKSEIILIGGYSGVGKSSLVREINKPITQVRGYFLTGKYDQYNRNLPFSAFIQVFTNLVRLILTEQPDEIQKWKDKILHALGNNGQVVIKVIPELEFIIGNQPELTELGAQENANRFYLVFQNFIKVFANADHPLAIFLDDMQWADSGSLALIKNLIEDESVQYIYFMLAFRDNEVDKTHPLEILFEDLRKTGSLKKSITLKPLSRENVVQLLSDSLHCEAEKVTELSGIVFQKTGGNPFFISEFLKQLSREELIFFDYRQTRWDWKTTEIKNVQISENVVELLIKRIKRLDSATQNILKLSSCIGNIFDLATLSLIYEKNLRETSDALKTAIQEEFIVPIGDTYKLVESMEESPDGREKNIQTARKIQYKFQHDRVQQASYEMLEETHKKELRISIGKILYKSIAPEKQDDFLFDIVNHFNVGSDLLKTDEELNLLIVLNTKAGSKAKESTAYKPSLEYFKIALSTLRKWKNNKNWETDYSLSMQISRETSELEYLNGNFEESEKIINEILKNSRTTLEKAEIYNLLIVQYCALGKYDRAFEIINVALKPLGLELPSDNFQDVLQEDLAQISVNLKNREVGSLLDEPEMQDPIKRITIKLLMNSLPMAYNLKPALFPIISAKMVNIFLQYGILAESYGFSCYAIVLATGFANYKEAYEYSLLAMKISEKFGSQSEKTKAANVLANYTTPFVKHIKYAEEVNLEGLNACYDSGEFLHGSYSAMNICLNAFYQGIHLRSVYENKIINLLQFAQKIKSTLSIDTINAVNLIIHNLLDLTESSLDFKTSEHSEAEFLGIWESHQSKFPECLYRIMKAQVAFLYGMYDSALIEIQESEKILAFISGQNSAVEHIFYQSLIYCSLVKDSTKQQKTEYLAKIKANRDKLKGFAKSSPATYNHKYLLIEAELSRIEYKNWKAAKLYDECIDEAKKNEFHQIRALASELAGRFWLNKKSTSIAQDYLITAYRAYETWGATRKLKLMKEEFPELLTESNFNQSLSKTISTTTIPSLSTGTNPTQMHGGSSLDFQSIIKSSSAISGEIKLESLLQKIMNIVIENAGAQRGVLLLKKNDELFIQAEGSTTDTNVNVMHNIPLKSYNNLPHSLIYYVERTKESHVLQNASQDDKFSTDVFIQTNQIKSILCAPILKQGLLTGILYVENNLSAGSFTADRLQVINVLSSQAAISIDNAILYENLEQKVFERTRELAKANSELEEKNHHITDSIQYAKTIQQAILPSKSAMYVRYDDIFVTFFPKDIVSGDFFWHAELDDCSYIAAVDCTGHGVPGAFMSMIGTAILNQIVKEMKISDPAKILEYLNIYVRRALKQDSNREDASRDGMEICLCKIEKDRVVFSGGHRPLYYAKGGEVFTIKGDKESIGGKQKTEERTFTNHQILLEKNVRTAIYLTTDGFQDQSNRDGKKIGSKGILDMISRYHNLDGLVQKDKFEEELKSHMNGEPQRDDITLICVIFKGN